MDPMTLLVSAIGSMAACIAYLYKQQEKRAELLQKKYDELLQFQRNDMTTIIAKYHSLASKPKDGDTLLHTNTGRK